jgi:hypothetical protein
MQENSLTGCGDFPGSKNIFFKIRDMALLFFGKSNITLGKYCSKWVE